MSEPTTAQQIQRARVALQQGLSAATIAARYWRDAPENPERRRKFFDAATMAERKALTLDELLRQQNGAEQ